MFRPIRHPTGTFLVEYGVLPTAAGWSHLVEAGNGVEKGALHERAASVAAETPT